MRMISKLFFLLVLLPSVALAQQELSAPFMIKHFKDNPIVCYDPEGGSGCSSIEEYSFLTGSKGLVVGSVAFEVDRRQYLRMTVSTPISVKGNSFCFRGAQPIRDAHLEIVNKLNYQGNFRRSPLPASAQELVEKQFLNPMTALLGSSTVCTKFNLPKARDKTYEVGYVTYLDGEVMDEGRAFIYGRNAASQLILTPGE